MCHYEMSPYIRVVAVCLQFIPSSLALVLLILQLNPLSFRRAAVVIELVQVLCALKRNAMQLTISYVLDIRSVLSTLTRYEI